MSVAEQFLVAFLLLIVALPWLITLISLVALFWPSSGKHQADTKSANNRSSSVHRDNS